MDGTTFITVLGIAIIVILLIVSITRRTQGRTTDASRTVPPFASPEPFVDTSQSTTPTHHQHQHHVQTHHVPPTHQAPPPSVHHMPPPTHH
ncbi:MAG: hypothetical protein JO031_07245 [Ktedonobacteraceae bacterium]|nr:hypothetical protein [Ktedonobacteraceae bacterium]